MAEEVFMRQALKLAAKGRPWPNPFVGAVVVKNGEVVGEGFHPEAGLPHAEIYALKEAEERARGATLYVTLEPCCHFGRTPPCTEAIKSAGIRRVEIATLDPNPEVGGRGVEILREAGLEVKVGLLGEEARQQNEVFWHQLEAKRPFFTLKLAQSLDGKVATKTGESQWISSEASRRRVHQLRAEKQAIMVGAGTVRKDDPRLNARIPQGTDPLRIIVATHGQIPDRARLWQIEAPLLIAVAEGIEDAQIQKLEKKGAKVLVLPKLAGRVELLALAAALYREGIVDVFLEGGPQLAASMLAADLVDKFLLFLAPKVFGAGGLESIGGEGWGTILEAPQFQIIDQERSGEDLLLTLKRR